MLKVRKREREREATNDESKLDEMRESVRLAFSGYKKIYF
jgi:hypothetical protein